MRPSASQKRAELLRRQAVLGGLRPRSTGGSVVVIGPAAPTRRGSAGPRVSVGAHRAEEAGAVDAAAAAPRRRAPGWGIRPKTLRAGVDDAGDVVQRAVRIGLVGGAAGAVDVAQDDLAVVLELPASVSRIGDVAALAVLDRQASAPPPGRSRGERRVGLLDAQRDRRADETRGCGCGSARRAAGRPRRGPGSRCRCRSPARPRAAKRDDALHDRRESAPSRPARR